MFGFFTEMASRHERAHPPTGRVNYAMSLEIVIICSRWRRRRSKQVLSHVLDVAPVALLLIPAIIIDAPMLI